MPWWLVASLTSNAAIMCIEYANRTLVHLGVLGTFARTWPLIIVAQIGLLYAFRGAPSWLFAWACFTVGNAAFRIAAVSTTHASEVGSWPITMAGVALMLGGAFLVKEGMT